MLIAVLAMFGAALAAAGAASAQDPSLCYVKPPEMRCDAEEFGNFHVEQNDDPVVEQIPLIKTIEPRSETTYQANVALGQHREDQAASSSACNLSCASYTWETGTSESQVPEWVKALDVYEERLSGGYRTTGVTYFTDGSIVIAAANRGDCQDRRVCMFQHAGFSGKLFQGQGVGRLYDLSAYEMSRRGSSAINTGHTSCMINYGPGSDYWKLPPRHQTGNFGGYYNDKAHSVEIHKDGSAANC